MQRFLKSLKNKMREKSLLLPDKINLEGLDDIGITLRHTDDVLAYEAQRKPWLPSVTV